MLLLRESKGGKGMGRRLLTLAIACNVKTQSYEVICYDLHKERLIPLELENIDIEGKDGI